MSTEPLSDLLIQLELSEIHHRMRSLRERVEVERTDPESGPFFAHLKFAENSVRSAAGLLDHMLSSPRNPHPSGPRIVPERKRWSLFRD